MTEQVKTKSQNRRLHVLQVIGTLRMGGTENQTLLLLEHFDRNRFIMDVCCTENAQGELSERFFAAAGHIFTCKWSRYICPFVFRLAKMLLTRRYDVVHSRLSEVNGAVILASALSGVPCRIASYHHTQMWVEDEPGRRLAMNVLKGLTTGLATRILGNAESVLDAQFDNWRQRPQKFLVCHNGIDFAQFAQNISTDVVRNELGIPIDAFVLGHIGSFRELKNHRTIIKVAKQLLGKYSHLHVLLVGDGPLRKELEDETIKEGISQNFTFTGVRQDINRILAALDVFFFPSYHEGFPSVVAEAQAAGKVVVGSDIASIKQVLCPEMRQLCKSPVDTEGFIKVIAELLQRQDWRQSLGKQGRQYVMKRYSVERMVESLQNLYVL